MRIPSVRNGIKKIISVVKQEKENIKEYFHSPSNTRLFAIFAVVAIVLAIPITVTFLGQQTNLEQHAYVPGGGGTCKEEILYSCSTSGNHAYIRTAIGGDCSRRTSSSFVCGKCGYNPTKTQYQVCNGNQLCNKNYYSCTGKFISWTSCSKVQGRCGVPYTQPTIPPLKFYCSDSTHYKADNPIVNGKTILIGGTWTCTSGTVCKGGPYATSQGNVNAGQHLCVADYSPCTTFNARFSARSAPATTSAECQTAAKSVVSNCKYPQYYAFVDNGGNNPQCIFKGSSSSTENSNNDCTLHNGACQTGSSQGTTCKNILNSYNYACTGQNQFCCGDSVSLTNNSCTSHGGTCKPSSSQGYTTCGTISTNAADNTACDAATTNSFCCLKAATPHGNYGTCAGLDSNHSICTDTSCPATGGYVKTASNACSGKTPNGLTKICCTRSTSSNGSGGTGDNGDGSSGGGSSCTNGKTTKFTLNLKLDGIGTESFSNHLPAHTTRKGIYVKVTDSNNTSLYNNTSTTFTYAASGGTFNAPKVDLSTKLSCGHTYAVTVKIPRYLPVKATVEYGTDKTITLNPIAGDINGVTSGVITGDNSININDYALVAACRNKTATTTQTLTSGSSTVTVTCGDLMNFIDYADGGTTGDEWSFNYNLWARGFFKANGY